MPLKNCRIYSTKSNSNPLLLSGSSSIKRAIRLGCALMEKFKRMADVDCAPTARLIAVSGVEGNARE